MKLSTCAQLCHRRHADAAEQPVGIGQLPIQKGRLHGCKVRRIRCHVPQQLHGTRTALSMHGSETRRTRIACCFRSQNTAQGCEQCAPLPTSCCGPPIAPSVSGRAPAPPLCQQTVAGTGSTARRSRPLHCCRTTSPCLRPKCLLYRHSPWATIHLACLARHMAPPSVRTCHCV